MFRGREIVHKDIGQKVLMRVVEDLKDLAIVEQTPRMEGRQMFMILAPNPKYKPPKEAKPAGGADRREAVGGGRSQAGRAGGAFRFLEPGRRTGAARSRRTEALRVTNQGEFRWVTS